MDIEPAARRSRRSRKLTQLNLAVHEHAGDVQCPTIGGDEAFDRFDNRFLDVVRDARNAVHRSQHWRKAQVIGESSLHHIDSS